MLFCHSVYPVNEVPAPLAPQTRVNQKSRRLSPCLILLEKVTYLLVLFAQVIKQRRSPTQIVEEISRAMLESHWDLLEQTRLGDETIVYDGDER